MGVLQPFSSAGWDPFEIKWASAASTKAFVVEPPFHSVSGVAGVSGRIANP